MVSNGMMKNKKKRKCTLRRKIKQKLKNKTVYKKKRTIKTMKNKKKRSGGGNKKNIFENDNNMKSGGVFCYMPYESLDKSNKSIFKIDVALNLQMKISELKKNVYPEGFYVTSWLLSPKLLIEGYESIMDFMVEYVIENGGKIQEGYEKGWVYCDEDLIHNAFDEAYKKYGGDLKKFDLSGRGKGTFKVFLEEKHTDDPEFVGRVVFHT